MRNKGDNNTMSKFFKAIVEYELYSTWADTLDWLLDDDKFSEQKGWNSNKVRKLSNIISNFPEFKKDMSNYQHDAIKKLKFPKKRRKTVIAIFSNGSAQCKDFIRHIRNGIAHGNAECFNNNNTVFIEIKAFSKDKKELRAYMSFPIDYITKLYKAYTEVQKDSYVLYDKKDKKSA